MKIAFVMSGFDYSNVDNKYGIGYYITEHFKKNGCEIEYFLHKETKSELFFKVKQGIKKYILNKKYLRQRDTKLLQIQTKPLNEIIEKSNCDIVFSFGSLPIAMLETKKPIFFWTDAFFNGLTGFYEEYSGLSEETINNANLIEKLAIKKSRKVFVSSQWAKEDAVNYYNANEEKIIISPFGPNLDIHHTEENIFNLIVNKDFSKINFLFLGKEWKRKGGDIALEITEKLNKLGIHTLLRVVGCKDLNIESEYIENYGFLNKKIENESEKLFELFRTSHYLIMPSRAETFGHVFCEANAYGLPCIASKNGGIPSVISNNVNGFINNEPEKIVDFISYKFNNIDEYKNLCKSSYQEFIKRLNWDTSIQYILNVINSSFS